MSYPRLTLASGVSFFDAGRIVLGGTPRRLSRINKPTQELMSRLRLAGTGGVELSTEDENSVAKVLIDRGLAHPLPAASLPSLPKINKTDVEIVIPTRGRVAQVARLLESLDRPNVVVIDDASEPGDQLADVVERYGARLIRHLVNTGPAGARNTGIEHTRAPFIAFLDSDCIASPDWPYALLSHFEDPRVAMVASRVIHRGTASTRDTALDRYIDDYETCHGALDAGLNPSTVGPNSAISSVPSAAIVLRRSAIEAGAFDEDLRIGEDLDLIWRLCASGWIVRHDPTTVVEHESITHFPAWIRRRYEYGTFAGPIETRHPGKLIVTFKWWSLAMVTLAVTGHPVLALTVGVSQAANRWWSIRTVPDAVAIAATITAQEIVQEWQDISWNLRSTLWPVGAVILLSSPVSPAARRASVIILAPLVTDLLKHRPRSSALGHSLLDALEQAAVGTGVAVSLARSRRLGALLPRVRMPKAITQRFSPHTEFHR